MERCPLCQSDRIGILYAGNIPSTGDRGAIYNCTSFALGVHPDIFRCRDCTFVFNEPARGLVNHLDEYAGVEDPEFLEQRDARRVTYARELDRIEPLCAGRDLLDVGCYAGFFLDDARRRGWNVAGVEPCEWAAQHARDQLHLDVSTVPIEECDPTRRFDVVTMWDVLEHLADPVRAIRKIHRLLRPNGLLVFATHNLDAPIARLMGSRYPFFMEMHTIHLNNRTRDLLLARTGFELVERHTHRRALRLGYLITRFRRVGEMPTRLAIRLATALGLADRMVWIGFSGLETVVARRMAPGTDA
jgi:2-polyprenyl-3-methyl-5-hydroxy-6-metoxy-1,4-benzoquinol methylase